MDIEVLKEFIMLSEELNFTTSASRCHLSQPTFSRHIQSLEKELGLQLFNRNKNLVELTAAGKAFLPGAEKIVYDYDVALDIVRNIKGNTSNTLNVAYIGETLEAQLDSIYAKHLERAPYVKLNLMSSWESRLVVLLDKGKADLIITTIFDKIDSKAWDSLKLGTDSYSLIVPKGHNLYNKEKVSLHQLGNHDMVLIPNRRDSPFQYEHLNNVLMQKAHGVQVEDRINDKHDIAALCNAELSVSLVRNAMLPHLDLGDARAIPLTDEELQYDICAIWQKDSNNEVVLNFVKILEEEVAE